MNVAVLRYNAGNVRSVIFALNRLGIDPVWTDSPSELHGADRVIVPGVGEASSAMQYLRERGLDRVLADVQAPVLGICLGLQLFCARSEENDTKCLGIFEERVLRFSGARKVPHIGWNSLHSLRGPLFRGVCEGAYAYFVHSFYAEPSSHTIAETRYEQPFSAALQRGNFFGVQFHPEKSGQVGERILRNFLELESHA